MFDHERTLNEFMVAYLEKLVSDIAETDLDHQPVQGMNLSRWILGHLAVNTDYGLRMLGIRLRCPIDWHRSFARGSEPLSRPDPLPSKTELFESIRTGFATLRELSQQVDVADMHQPHAVPFLKATAIKTKGEVLAHLMTTHLATHTGQLSYWRRAVGRPRMEPGEGEP